MIENGHLILKLIKISKLDASYYTPKCSIIYLCVILLDVKILNL